MTEKTNQDRESRRQRRALRRARRYIRANEGSLARVLNAYQNEVARDPVRDFWPVH